MEDKLDIDFVNQVICSGLKDKKILDLLLQFVKPEYMPNESYRKLWRCIGSEFKLDEAKNVPKIGVLKMHFRKDEDILGVINDIKEILPDSDHHDDVLRNLEEFVKQNMFVEIYNEVGENFNRGKKNEAYQKFVDMSDKFSKFSIKGKTYEKVFGDFYNRSVQREFDKINNHLKRQIIPSGIDELDKGLNGGFETGTFTLITAESGVGKSFFGNHIGTHAARLGYHVMHEQAEGTKEQVMNRYDSCWTGTRYHDVKSNSFKAESSEKIRRVINNIRGEIHVNAHEKFGGASILDVRSNLRQLKKQGYDIKLVIIDYLELLELGDGVNYGPNDEKHRQPKLATYCKQIAMEENVAVVAFTQATIG